MLRKEGKGLRLARPSQAQSQSNGGRGHPQAPLRHPRQTVLSSSFLERANQAAAMKKVKQAYRALAQYEFAYNPERVRRAVAKDPLFLGVFAWNDSEDVDD